MLLYLLEALKPHELDLDFDARVVSENITQSDHEGEIITVATLETTSCSMKDCDRSCGLSVRYLNERTRLMMCSLLSFQGSIGLCLDCFLDLFVKLLLRKTERIVSHFVVVISPESWGVKTGEENLEKSIQEIPLLHERRALIHVLLDISLGYLPIFRGGVGDALHGIEEILLADEERLDVDLFVPIVFGTECRI
jgi:hypothetical protein